MRHFLAACWQEISLAVTAAWMWTGWAPLMSASQHVLNWFATALVFIAAAIRVYRLIFGKPDAVEVTEAISR